MAQFFSSIDWVGLSRMNIERTRLVMKEASIDLVVCNGMENVRYLTGFSPHNAMSMFKTHLVILPASAEDPTLFTLNYYPDYVKEAAPWLTDVRTFSKDLSTEVADYIRSSQIRNTQIAIDPFVSFADGQQLSKKVEEFGCHVIGSDIMARARIIKNAIEISIIREAAAIAEMGMKKALESCIEGFREYEVAANAEFAMRSAGAEGPAFPSVISSGVNGAILKEISTDKRLRNGELVLIDQGALYEGYNAEFTRIGCVGRPNEDQKKAYKTVLEAEQTAIRAVAPGKKAGEIDKIARDVINNAGWGEWAYNYGTGHGIGVAVWEPPGFYPGSEDVLEAGMVVAVEPGIHKLGLGGIRIEDVVLITDSGPEILTKTNYWEI